MFLWMKNRLKILISHSCHIDCRFIPERPIWGFRCRSFHIMRGHHPSYLLRCHVPPACVLCDHVPSAFSFHSPLLIDPAFQNWATFHYQEPASLQTRVSCIPQHIGWRWEEHRSQDPRRHQGQSPASEGPARGSCGSCCSRRGEHRLGSHGEPRRGWKGENPGTYQRADKGEAVCKASSPSPPLPEH